MSVPSVFIVTPSRFPHIHLLPRMALKMKWEFWHLLLKTKEYFTASALPANPPYRTLECFNRDTISIHHHHHHRFNVCLLIRASTGQTVPPQSTAPLHPVICIFLVQFEYFHILIHTLSPSFLPPTLTSIAVYF